MKRLAPLVLIAMLAACGGGGGASTPPTNATPQSGATKMALTFHFKTKSGAIRTSGARKPNYVSYSTQGMGIDVLPALGDSTLPKSSEAALQSPAFATQIAAGFTGPDTTCSAAVGGAYSCTVLVTAPSGYDDIQITTWDAPPGAGPAYFSGANDLSTTFLPGQLILANQTNSENFTLDGVVASVALQVTPNQLISGQAPATGTLSVFAKDAGGNYIIADPYADANGNLITINVAKSENYYSPVVGPVAPANGDVTFDPGDTNCTATTCSYTSASITTDQIDYNGYDIQGITFSASTTSPLDSSIAEVPASIAFTRSTNGPITVPGPPAVALFSTNLPAASLPYRAALGSDNRVWFALSGTASLAAVDPAGNITAYPINNPTNATAAGPDGDIWYTENTGRVGRINVDGSGNTDLSLTHPATLGLTSGPDGNVWVPEGNLLAQIASTPTGGAVSYEYAGIGTSLTDITSGPNGHLWVLDTANNSIDEVSTTGARLNSYVYGTADVMQSIIAAQDGNLWFGDYTAGKVIRMTPAGVFTTYSIGGNTQQLAAGPDGNVWAASDGPAYQIVRIDTTTGSVQKYTNNVPNEPTALARGADGNLWFGVYGGNQIGKLTP